MSYDAKAETPEQSRKCDPQAGVHCGGRWQPYVRYGQKKVTDFVCAECRAYISEFKPESDTGAIWANFLIAAERREEQEAKEAEEREAKRKENLAERTRPLPSFEITRAQAAQSYRDRLHGRKPWKIARKSGVKARSNRKHRLMYVKA